MTEFLESEDVVADHNRYRLGFTTFPEPDEKDIRHMLYLVAYDIADPKRLRKVAKICELYGVRIEKSVFECDLPPDQFRTFWRELGGVLETADDALIAYRICRSCIRDVESTGQIFRPEKTPYYIL